MHYSRTMQRVTTMSRVNALLKLLRDIDAARQEAVQELNDQISALTLEKLREAYGEAADSMNAEMVERKDKLKDCLRVLEEFEKRRQDAITALSAAA